MKRIFTLMIAIMMIAMSMTAEEYTHVVKKGETIESIAKSYGVSTERLMEANPLLKQYLYVGMILKVPEKVETVTESAPTTVAEVESIAEPITEPVSIAEEPVIVESNKQNKDTGKTEYIYLGGAYLADFDFLDAGMYGVKIDRVTPNGWNANMRILTNWGIKGVDFTEQDVMFWLGANYCPSASKNHFFYIPMLLSWIVYDEIKTTIDDNNKTKTESKAKLGVGLALEPSIMLRFGDLNLTAGVNLNWFTNTKKINAELAIGVIFELYKNR